MNRSQTILLIAIAMCGGFIIVLSLMNWVEFQEDDPSVFDTPLAGFSFTLGGPELSRIQGAIELPDAREQGDNACTCRAGFGDGYITAALGAILLATASAAVLIRSRPAAFAVVAVLASLAAVAIGGYNATGIWEGVGARSGDGAFLNMTGDVTFELFTLTAVAALGAVLGAVVLMTAARDALERAEEEAEEGELEEAGGWA